jgi:hypothetical protein
MASRDLDLATVDALRAAALRFGPEHRTAKSRALSAAASCALTDPAALLAYHDCLLCLIAYPETRELFAVTRGNCAGPRLPRAPCSRPATRERARSLRTAEWRERT